MLVVDGAPIALERHLARLGDSVRTLYRRSPPDSAADLVEANARDLTLGRLRLTLTPDDDGGLRSDVATAAVDPASVFPSWERAVDLRPVVVDGGLGAHKWADRRLLVEAETAHPETVALVVDRDGAVLEASRASIFAIRDGIAATPPADGRILPGTVRTEVAGVLDELGIELREEVLAGEELSGADELFLTGSVRGVEPVRSIAGIGAWSPGELTPLIAGALRQRWLGAVARQR